MKTSLTFFLFLFFNLILKAQLYFPPNNSLTWETMSPAELNWCPEKIDSLYQLLEDNDTKAFIVLKDGKIVLEEYFNGHTMDSPWNWASAGKSLMAVLVGIAQQEGALSIQDSSSDYLGTGWTACTPEQEAIITVRDQLAMTTGLNDDVPDSNCTLDSCLTYLTVPGDRWAYHNGPYTSLGGVIENATGMDLNQYTNQKIKSITGMTGSYLPLGYNNVFFSTGRSMARFGLLILNQGNWNGTPVLSDVNYFQEMTNTSQEHNDSYGYLWWLNGKNSFLLPGLQVSFPGSINPNGPDDLIMALGKNGQYINVVPSQNLVMIRMGNNPENTLVPILFNNEIWARMNALECSTVGIDETLINSQFLLSPNPVTNFLSIEIPSNIPLQAIELNVFDLLGNQVHQVQPKEYSFQIEMASLPKGIYFVSLKINEIRIVKKIIRR